VTYKKKSEQEKDERNGLGESGVQKMYSQRGKTKS